MFSSSRGYGRGIFFLSLDNQGLFLMFRSIRATRMKMPRPYPLDDENMAG